MTAPLLEVGTGLLATSMRGITSVVSNQPPVALTAPCRNTTREIAAGLLSLTANHTREQLTEALRCIQAAAYNAGLFTKQVAA